MAFDPSSIPDDTSFEGHLSEHAMVDILLAVQASAETGCLAIHGPDGEDQMFFMRGQPVGVKLATYLSPLGQLLLELGLIDASTFIRAQRLIKSGNRLPGRVFQELGVLDEPTLKQVLDLQTRRKAERFCSRKNLPFSFGKGLTYLTGFNSAPLDVYMVTFLALRQQMNAEEKQRYLESLSDRQVLVDPGRDALPAPLPAFGFGKAEERFLARLQSGWQDTSRLAETGTLPADEVAVLLRFLELLGRLHTRPKPGAKNRAPAAPLQPLERGAAEEKTEITSERRLRQGSSDVTDPGIHVPDDIHDEPTDLGDIAPIVRRKPRSLPDANGKKRKKKQVRRKEALPSLGASAVSVTKKEKTEIGPMPTIVIDED